MTLSNKLQLGLGAVAAVVVAVGLIVAVGPAPAPAPAPVPTAAAPVESAPADVTLKAPYLDTFRVEPDGTSVLAGRAEPMMDVAVLVNGDTIATASADASGSFVVFPIFAPSAQPRILSLVGNPTGIAILANKTYVISPVAGPQMSVADVDPALADTTTLTEVIELDSVTAQSNDPALLPDIVATTAPTITVETNVFLEPSRVPTAPSILATSNDGVKVVQAGGDTSPDVLSNVALDSITYDPSGDVLLAGRALGTGSVQIYIDNQPITTSRITIGGDWHSDLPDVDTGVYTLRVDELDNTGAVVSRIETPFKREEPEVVVAAMAEQTQAANFQVAVTTVQPGTTLWAIAQERFGNGIMYVKVFEANRDRIRDPNLIYPGQVFRVPEDEQ